MKPILVLLALLLQTSAPVSSPTTFSVSGRVVRFPDAVSPPSALLLRSFALHEMPGQGKTTAIHADGTFEFTDVLPPECDLNLYDVRQAIGPGLNFSFSGNNVTGIEIKVPAGLKGRILMADGGPMPAVIVTSTTPLGFNSSFRSGRSMWTQANPGSDAQFTLGVFPGQNRITVSASDGSLGSRPLPAGYAVKSMTYGAVDVMANGLVLTALPTSTLVITLGR